MLNPDVRRVLDGNPVAHIATVLPDGGPHTVPVWIGTHGDQITVLTGPDSRKARARVSRWSNVIRASTRQTSSAMPYAQIAR